MSIELNSRNSRERLGINPNTMQTHDNTMDLEHGTGQTTPDPYQSYQSDEVDTLKSRLKIKDSFF